MAEIKECKSGIYMIKNKVNEKIYIGSAVNIENRWRQHKYSLKLNKHHSRHLQKSWDKYSKENFEFSILEVVEDKKRLLEREQYWMDFYKSYDVNKGYNISPTARNCLGVKHTEETKNKASIRMKKQMRQLSNEERKKFASYSFFGQKHTAETKNKASIRMKGVYVGNKNPNYNNRSENSPLSKTILQINPETLEIVKLWNASIDIWRDLKFHSGNICKICILVNTKNQWKKYKQFYWCYNEDIEKLKNKQNYINPQYKKVFQIDIDSQEIIGSFDKISDAADYIKVRSENISRCCKGKNSTAGGYIWIYLDEYSDELKNRRIRQALTTKENTSKIRCQSLTRKTRPTIQINLNGVLIKKFTSMQEASDTTGVGRSNIQSVCSGKHKSAGGYKWMYLEDYEKMIKEQKDQDKHNT